MRCVLCLNSVTHYADGHDESSVPPPLMRSKVSPLRLEVKDEKGKLVSSSISSSSVLEEIPLSELIHEGQTAEMWSLDNQIASGVSLTAHGAFISSSLDETCEFQNNLDSISDAELDSSLGVSSVDDVINFSND